MERHRPKKEHLLDNYDRPTSAGRLWTVKKMRRTFNRRALAPAAPQDFFQDETAAEVGEAKGDKAPQIQGNSTFPPPAPEMSSGDENAEQQQSEKGQGGLMRQVLREQVFDKRKSRHNGQQ